MIIEYFGISGVGKTTMAKEYYEVEKKKGTIIVWDGYNLYQSHSWFFRNLMKSLAVYKYSITHIKWCLNLNDILHKALLAPKDYYTLLFNGIFLKYLISKRKSYKYSAIFDEGVFQFIWSIGLRMGRGIIESDITKIVNLFGLPDKLIVVEATSDVIAERILNRGEKVRIQQCTNLVKRIDEMESTLKNILTIVSKNKKSFTNSISYIRNDKSRV